MDTKQPTDTMNIALPEAMKQFVHEQVAQGGYTSASEYVRELIRDAQKRQAQEELEALLIEGLNSGPSVEVDEKFWKELRDRSEARWTARTRTKA